MKKLFTLLTLALLSVGSAWAETETPGKTGTSNENLVGTCYSIAGTFVAGNGSANVSPMKTNGVKVRLNRESNTLVIKVNAGYEINGLTIYGISNTTGKTSSVKSITVDGTEKLTSSIAIPAPGSSTAATISVADIAAKEDITLTFEGEATQANFDFHFTYTQKEVIVQEITAVALNGTAISDNDLATLISEKSVTIDGSELNGAGMVAVTLSTGATTVTKSFSDGKAVYSFTINGTDKYTVTVTGVAKTYTKQGVVAAFSEDGIEVSGTNTSEVVSNGITFTYATKTFQYGSGSVTLGSNKYVPLKLSTGEAVNVTFPEGKKATKIIVYGWSANGDGQLTVFQETSDVEGKIVDVSDDIYYATNTSADIYPSVYEYEVDNWESLYFTGGGSNSQPFVVMDFVFAPDAPAEVEITTTKDVSTYVTTATLDFSNVVGLKAWYATSFSAESVTLEPVNVAPANTPLVLQGKGTFTVPVITDDSGASISGNLLVAGPADLSGDGNEYILSDGLFYQATAGHLAEGKAFLSIPYDARSLSLVFAGEATGIETVKGVKADGVIYNLNGQRVVKAQKGLYIQDGKKLLRK